MTDEETVHIACPECDRVLSDYDRDDAGDTVSNHNDSRHDGNPIARIFEDSDDGINQLVDDIRDEYGFEEYETFLQRLVKKDPTDIRN